MTEAITPTGPAADTLKPLPEVGKWYHVQDDPDSRTPEKPGEIYLACCEHVGSNFARFTWHHADREYSIEVMLWECHRWNHAPEWAAYWQGEIEDGQKRLHAAVMALAGQFNDVGLLPTAATSIPSTALVTSRGTVAEQKAELVRLREEGLKGTEKSVKEITGELVGYQKNLFLGPRLQAKKMMQAADIIEQKLFALELYAGFGEAVHMIKDGEPAASSEPVHVLQMLRFMDEETLIAATDGGMNFADLDAFDDWAAEHVEAIAPYPRYVVAWQVRRHRKDYGRPSDIAEALQHMRFHDYDKQTYLLIRNGAKLYRAVTELDFAPRLIPFREEFEGPLTEEHRKWNFGQPDEITVETIGPQHRQYDNKLGQRAREMRHYNRIVFLIQGLLDRSEVFAPHPPIDLASEQGAEWLKQVRDEEDGLPTSQPIEWDAYRDGINADLKKGDTVYAIFPHVYQPRSWHQKREEYTMRGFYRVEGFTKDGKQVRLSEPKTRSGWQYPSGWNKDAPPGMRSTYGEWGDWSAGRAHYTAARSRVFNVRAYTPGAYKAFLCDPHAKGKYLEWAIYLLKAEKWHKEPPAPATEETEIAD